MFDLNDLDELEKQEERLERVSEKSEVSKNRDQSGSQGIACRADPRVFFKKPKAHAVGRAAVENAYLERHGILEMFNEVLLVLTYEQPEDPHVFLIDCIKKYATARAWSQPQPIYKVVSGRSGQTGAAARAVPQHQPTHRFDSGRSGQPGADPSLIQESPMSAISKHLSSWWRSTPTDARDSETLRGYANDLRILEEALSKPGLTPADVMTLESLYKTTLKYIGEEQERIEKAKSQQEVAELCAANTAAEESKSSFIGSLRIWFERERA